MNRTALALVSSLLVLAACADSSTTDGSAGGAGGATAGLSGPYAAGSVGELATNVGDRVFFAYDSSVLTSEAQIILDRQAEWLKGNTDVNIAIEGHADERGTREYNIALGERRASATKDYLVSQGVASSRVSTLSYGKERPAVVGNDEGAWSQNRRSVTVLAQ